MLNGFNLDETFKVAYTLLFKFSIFITFNDLGFPIGEHFWYVVVSFGDSMVYIILVERRLSWEDISIVL